jgi:hypothetical protein
LNLLPPRSTPESDTLDRSIETERPARTCYSKINEFSLRLRPTRLSKIRARSNQGSFRKPDPLAPASKAVTGASNTYICFGTAVA